MKSSLPILTLMAALWLGMPAFGQNARPLAGDEPPAANDAPPADKLLASALAAIEAHNSIGAKIRHEVDLFGHRMVGSGAYLQQGRGGDRRLRLELKLQVDDQQSSLQHVCDGKYLWMHQDVLGKATLAKIDMNRLRNALVARPNFTTPAPTMWTALGGLPKLLKGLDESYAFTSARSVQLDQLAMWSLEGRLRTEKLAELLPDQKEKILAGQTADLTKLSEQVPRRVVLIVGQDDLFPYRIEYWSRKPPTKKSPASGERLIVIMELFEVQFDAPIDPRQFTYNPGDLQADDQTAEYLQKLGFTDNRVEPTGARPTQRTPR